MMGTINCVYETPCGWCSKWDKKCDLKIGMEMETKVSQPSTSPIETVKKTSSYPKKCKYCEDARMEENSISSHPIKCTRTNTYHPFDDICDCEAITVMG